MSSISPIEHASPSVLGAISTGCDFCHSTDFSVLFDAPDGNSRIVICENCRLIYVSPPLSPEALDRFYDDVFNNDSGCQVRVGSNFPRDKDRKKEEVLAETSGIKTIKRFIVPRGKKILDLRCRTGALTSILKQEGANVIGVEPFRGNTNYARQVRGLTNIIDLPFSRFHQLPSPHDEYFDMVNILSHHVLAHVLSPRRLLEHIFRALKPGGYIFLDEKDVLHPVRHKMQSALDSGPAHQFHFTLYTTARYFSAIGFNLLEYEIDKNRSSDFRHIRIVAQKPKESRSTAVVSKNAYPESPPSVKAIRQRLWWLERAWNLRLVKMQIIRKSLKIWHRLGL